MRRLLLRAAVITGGSFAGLILGLSISGEAHADDRPRLLNGLVRGTVTDVLDDVLPDRPDRQPDNNGGGGSDKGSGKGQRDTPIRDVLDKVTDGVEDEVENTVKQTVKQVEHIITAPAQARAATSDDPTDPQADTPTDGADEPTDTDPVVDNELPDLPTDAPDQAQQKPAANLGEARRPYTTPSVGVYTCGHEWHQQHASNQRIVVRIAALRDAETAMPSYTRPAPPASPRPDQDVALTIASPHNPYSGLQQDATLTARATMPRTTAVRIPGRDQAADGTTCRPDAPSG